jgi:SNF2 family DNA or RNA helicase
VSEASRFYPSLESQAQNGTRFDPGRLPARSVLVINYTQLRLLQDDLGRISWLAIIFDEGQYLKNPASQTAQAARILKARHKTLLTGTPIENRLLDLWSLLHCVMPGALGSQASFTRRFQEKTDPTSRQRLARRVRPFLLRRTKEEVAPELPPRIEEDIRCQMEGAQENLYRAELKLARQHLLKLRDDQQLAQERFNLLTSLLRLRQICCHPALVDQNQRYTSSAKVDALVELLDPLIAEGNKVLIFSQFVEMLKLIAVKLKELEMPIYILTGETEGRAKVIEEFGNQPGGAVFLLSLKAGGFGLNLASASYVVLFDPWWNPAVENQAIDRAHRIGQGNTVFAYRLLIQGSIEDKIRQLQLYKSKLAREVLGEEGFAQALTLDDFRYLLS